MSLYLQFHKGSKKRSLSNIAQDKARLPVVVAKGQGAIADLILQKAKESGVAVQEDAALVEVLSKLDLDQQIPSELYQLVAEILSFVYQSDRTAGERRPE